MPTTHSRLERLVVRVGVVVWLSLWSPLAVAGPDVAELEAKLATITGKARVELLNQLSEVSRAVSVATCGDYANQALTLATELDDREGRAHALRNLAVAYSIGGDHQVALDHAEKALVAFTELGHRKGMAVSENTIGVCHRMLASYDDALVHYERALKLDRALGREAGIAQTLGNIANVHNDRSDYPRAYEVHLEALAIRERLGDRDGISSTLNNLGITLYRMGDFDQAIEKLLESASIDEELGDLHGAAASSLNIGNIFQQLGQLERALEYFERTRDITTRIGDKSAMHSAHNNIGNVYQVMKRYPEAIAEYEQSLELARATGSRADIAAAFDNLGVVHRNLEEYQVALDYHRQALAIREEIGTKNWIATSCQNLGKVLTRLGRFDEALPYLERGLAIAEEINSINHRQEIAENLYELFEAKGEFERALSYFKQSVAAKDSLLNQQTNEKITELEARYQAEARKREIALLQKENEIQRLEATRVRLRSRLVVGGLVLALLGLAWLGYRYRFFFNFWKQRSHVSHYKIIEPIATGGMGVVYRAVDLLGESRVCALKLMRDDQAEDEAARKRFLREAAIIDQLDDPHIVAVHERGEHCGRLFIAMELLEGPSLAELIGGGQPLALPVCRHILEQLIVVVARIHGRGVFHRDLKPDNIIIVDRDGDDHFVKMLDFGLAKTQSLTRLTEAGMIVGTIAYLPPEQITEQQFTEASDIYALGVVAYEMLTSKPPFGGATPAEVIKQILSQEPVPPQEQRPEIGDELAGLVLAMMAKEPSDRPKTAAIRERLAALSESTEVIVTAG